MYLLNVERRILSKSSNNYCCCINKFKCIMSTKSSVDLRAELAELVKRKAEIAVSIKRIVKYTLYFFY